MGTASLGNIPARKTYGIQHALVPVYVLSAIGFLIVGATLLLSTPWVDAGRYLDSRHWPTTDARILSVSLAEDRHADASKDGSTAELVLTVAYEYEVDGRTLTGYRASFNDRADPFDRRLRVLFSKLNFARLMNRPVPVAYDPDEPDLAYLDREFDWRPVALRAGLGAGAILFGIGIAVGRLRARANASLL